MSKSQYLTRSQAAFLAGVDSEVLWTAVRRKQIMPRFEFGDGKEGHWGRFTARQALLVRLAGDLARQIAGVDVITFSGAIQLTGLIDSVLIDGDSWLRCAVDNRDVLKPLFIGIAVLADGVEVPGGAKKWHVVSKDCIAKAGTLADVAEGLSNLKVQSAENPDALLVYPFAKNYRTIILLNLSHAVKGLSNAAEEMGFEVDPNFEMVRRVASNP